MNLNIIIPENDSVRLLSQFVEEMDLTCLYETYSILKENQVTPRQMLKIILYAYLDGRFSSREIERACHRDINFMYLLEGKPVPDHATIARFRTLLPVQSSCLYSAVNCFMNLVKFQEKTSLLTEQRLRRMLTSTPLYGKEQLAKTRKNLVKKQRC